MLIPSMNQSHCHCNHEYKLCWRCILPEDDGSTSRCSDVCAIVKDFIVVRCNPEMASNRATEWFTNDCGLAIADLSLTLVRILLNAPGAELMHLRTRWGLHAMHYAAGNLVQGCQFLSEIIGYCKVSSHQVVHCHLLIILFAR